MPKESEPEIMDEEIVVPEVVPEQKEKRQNTEEYIKELIKSIEEELPKDVVYTTGIVLDDDRNVFVIKHGKIMIGRDENDAESIEKYMENANLGYLMNSLYILRQQVNSYKDFWSGKLEREAKKTMNDII
jgi:hypothetical protein